MSQKYKFQLCLAKSVFFFFLGGGTFVVTNS